jgi:hypothetical protein
MQSAGFRDEAARIDKVLAQSFELLPIFHADGDIQVFRGAGHRYAVRVVQQQVARHRAHQQQRDVACMWLDGAHDCGEEAQPCVLT